MKLSVNKQQRKAKMRSHTATHLLHAEICKFLPNTKQMWSLVDKDLVRFDFASENMLSDSQLQTIEININNTIKSDNSVNIYEKSLPEAKAMWAKAFFEDKYGDIVRVVCVDWVDNNNLVSIELCWWTHVNSTSEIWIFKIISQASVASGTKRIIAYTWPKVLEYIYEQNDLLNTIGEKLSCEPKQAPEKVEKMSKDLATANSQIESFKSWAITNISWKQVNKSEYSANIYILDNSINIKDISNYLKGKDWNYIYSDSMGSFAIYSSSKQAKIIQTDLWIKWWWNDQMIQWKDENILEKLK